MCGEKPITEQTDKLSDEPTRRAPFRFDIATLFPAMCEAVVNESITGRAIRAGAIACYCHDIRDYTQDKHRRVDDSPYGGGMGMVMQAEPIYRCFLAVAASLPRRPRVIYLSPQGQRLTQAKAVSLSQSESSLFLLCGHYEGVDRRVLDKIVDEEISIGDYVLTGGELPALVLVDAVARMCAGVLPSEECFERESHYAGLLEHPQFTRPPEWEGMAVPEVLLSGHHANIEKWRREQMLKETYEKRRDMLLGVTLDKHDQAYLRRLSEQE